MSFPMFGANVSLLFLVFLFNHLITYSQIMCWFSFFMCLHFGDLQVSQKHQASRACFISSYVCSLVVCRFFKSTKLPMFILFLHVFVLWLFASFSRMPNFQYAFYFLLCLLYGHLQVFKNAKIIDLLLITS